MYIFVKKISNNMEMKTTNVLHMHYLPLCENYKIRCIFKCLGYRSMNISQSCLKLFTNSILTS